MLQLKNAFSSYSVNNLQVAKAFYRDQLGITVQDNAMGLIELHLSAGYHVLLYPKPDHQPATFTVLNFVVPQIDDAVQELAEKGIVFEQYGAPIKTDEKGISRNAGGPSIAWFKDPAGNILSVIQQTPAS